MLHLAGGSEAELSHLVSVQEKIRQTAVIAAWWLTLCPLILTNVILQHLVVDIIEVGELEVAKTIHMLHALVRWRYLKTRFQRHYLGPADRKIVLQHLLVEVEEVVVVDVVGSVLWRLGLMRWGEADIETMLQGHNLGLPHCQSRARVALINAGSEHIFLHQLLQLQLILLV